MLSDGTTDGTTASLITPYDEKEHYEINIKGCAFVVSAASS